MESKYDNDVSVNNIYIYKIKSINWNFWNNNNRCNNWLRNYCGQKNWNIISKKIDIEEFLIIDRMIQFIYS